MRIAPIGLLAVSVASSSANAATIVTNRAEFEAELGAKFIDEFHFRHGYPASFVIFKDDEISRIRGQTRFESTGFRDYNLIYLANNGTFAYCAGCNGSFRLIFDRTSYGSSRGVFGVGFDMVENSAPRFVASVTYGDGSVADLALPSSRKDGTGFVGLMSPVGIRSIHFGLPGGRPTSDGLFAIDNLTIGTSAAVPEPRVWAMMIAGFGAVGAALRRRRVSPDSGAASARPVPG